MADVLMAMHHLAKAEKEQEMIKLEEGEIKEFLRGTISIMDIKENCFQQLDALKEKFLRCRKELGGLDCEEFQAAVAPLIHKGISKNQIVTTFQKMDPCDDGAISWNDFINFAIEEHNKRIQMRATMDEVPFSPEAFRKRHNHTDTIMSIAFMPTVDPVSLHVDWGNGKYAILSREGIMSVWSASMKNLSYTYLSGRGRASPDWHLDLVTMYHNGFIAVATTLREISFYDYNMQGWSRKYWLRNLEHCVTKMNYWAGLDKEKIAVLVWGDTSGTVVMVEFDLSLRMPLFGIPVKEYCIELNYADLVRGLYKGVTHRIFKNVHADWVKQVRYMPKTCCVLSCCADTSTGLYMTPTEPTKRKPVYFTTMKGILSFDYGPNINLVAAAGIDNNIWLYNPYVPHKVIAIMEGHTRPITHVKINEEENYLLSADMGRNVLVFNLTRQVSIMRIPSQVLKMGFYPINAVYLNTERRMCILGGSSLVILKRRRLEGLNVEVRSHDEKLVAALYCPPYEQVVSVCRGAVVRVWDINTGTRVMQFVMAHSKKVHGRMVPVEIECAALTDNKKRLFTAAEGVVKIWNFSCGVLLRVLEPCLPHQRINSIVVAKSIIYITGWNKCITLYSDFKGEELLKKVWPQKHNEDCLGLCILEPNMIASCSYDGQIYVWSRETSDAYCKMSASFGHRPELEATVTAGGKGANLMGGDALGDNSDDGEEEGEDAFMTIGKHLNKTSGWYRGLRALKKRQIEREKRRMAKERKDFSAKFKKKKKRMNMQGLSLVYESAIECMVFLESRKTIDPQTAILVVAGAECWVRFWSLHPKGGLLGQFNSTRRKLESIRCMTTDKSNEYLLTGDTMGHLRIWDIKEFCNGVKLSAEEREAREARLRRDFVYARLPFKPEEVLNTMEKLRAMRISVPDASKPRINLKSPRLLSSIRAHTQAIMTIELIEDRNVILTSSQDRTVRLWTKNCTYIGTFGEHWRPLPQVVGSVVENPPRIPKDVLRCASARSLGTLHNGVMPHWKVACAAVRRHILELQRERQIEEAREKMKAEGRARGEKMSDDEDEGGEKQASKVLGKFYQPKRRYKGPLTTQALGFPELKVFRDKCAPYSSIPPRPFYPLVPLYSQNTLIDIDTRRRKKSKRILKTMLQQFSAICGEIQVLKVDQRSAASSTSYVSGSSEMTVRKQLHSSEGNEASTGPSAAPSTTITTSDSNKKKDHTWNRSPSPPLNRHRDICSSNTGGSVDEGQQRTADTALREEQRIESISLTSSLYSLPSLREPTPPGSPQASAAGRDKKKKVLFKRKPRMLGSSDDSKDSGTDDDADAYEDRRARQREEAKLEDECERYCYRERCGLPPIVHRSQRKDNTDRHLTSTRWHSGRTKSETDKLSEACASSFSSTSRDMSKGLPSVSYELSEGYASSLGSTSQRRSQRLPVGRHVTSMNVAGDVDKDVDDKSLGIVKATKKSKTGPKLHHPPPEAEDIQPQQPPRFTSSSSEPKVKPLKMRTFLHKDVEKESDEELDPGVQIYQQTRQMLEEARRCLAIDPEADLSDYEDLHGAEDDAMSSTISRTSSNDLRPDLQAMLRPDLEAMLDSDEVRSYMARKDRYKQAVKLNYKRTL